MTAKGVKPEDEEPQDSYPYMWSPDSDIPISEFASKHKPSMIQDDGTKPWIWVQSGRTPTRKDENVAEAVEEATSLLEEVKTKVQKIQDDPDIPLRSNKKKGTKSKKETRELEQAQASEKLKEISTRQGYVSGKMLVFCPNERVDITWKNVAESLLEGPLSKTTAYLAKVATCPINDTHNSQHIICIYVPDVYDQAAVTEVLRVLVRQHGITPNGVKSNLYTSIGLDSKHPSGIQSTVWKNTALIPDAELKALKGEYFDEIPTDAKVAPSSKAKEVAPTAAEGVSDDVKPASKVKAKSGPKLKRKAAADDPFASDSESDEPKKKARK
ncbi:hypothetical protein PENSPDRAFT_602017 [Peniophora sp. CONT]|nr:hypothetical protein PENSPDRAFT_602017 [Peniophora sp. CONT]